MILSSGIRSGRMWHLVVGMHVCLKKHLLSTCQSWRRRHILIDNYYIRIYETDLLETETREKNAIARLAIPSALLVSK